MSNTSAGKAAEILTVRVTSWRRISFRLRTIETAPERVVKRVFQQTEPLEPIAKSLRGSRNPIVIRLGLSAIRDASVFFGQATKDD
jgi:hypothetical protein